MADDLDHVLLHANLNRLTLVVRLMIDRVGKGLLDRCIGIVEEPLHFSLVRALNDLLGYDRVADVAKRRPKLFVQGAGKGLFDDLVSAVTFRELHDVDLGAGEELLWFRIEEHERHVLGFDIFRQRGDQVHIGTKVRERHVVRSVVQGAADFFEVGFDQHVVEVGHIGHMVHPVVERCAIGEVEQVLELIIVWNHGVR